MIIKAIMLQSFWFLAVLFGARYQSLIICFALLLAGLNFVIFRPFVGLQKYLLFMISFVLFGFLHDGSILWLGLISYGTDQFPFWLTSLYIAFLCYYGDIFNYLSKLRWPLQFIVGAVGGLSAYLGGARLAGFSVTSPWFYFYVAILWGVFFVFSLKFFYQDEKQGVRSAS